MRNTIITLLMILVTLANLPLNAAKLTLTPPNKKLPHNNQGRRVARNTHVPVLVKDANSPKSFCGYEFGTCVDSLQCKKQTFVKIDHKGYDKALSSNQKMPRPFRSFTNASIYYSRKTHTLYRINIRAGHLPEGVDWAEELQNVKSLLSKHYRVEIREDRDSGYEGGGKFSKGNVVFRIGFIRGSSQSGAMLIIDVKDLYYEEQARRESAEIRKNEAQGGTDVL